MKSLNGWQRLWIVLSAFYVVPVTLFTANSIAESEQYSASTRASYALKAFASYPETEKIKAMPLEDRRELAIDAARARRRLAGESHEDSQTDEDFARVISKKWAHVIDFSKMEAERKRMVEQSALVRAKTIGYGFLIWVAPVFLVYLLGLSFGWIARGFRGDRP